MGLKKGVILFCSLFIIGCSNNSKNGNIVRITDYNSSSRESTKLSITTDKKYHVVEKGQTLYGISKIYGIPISKLKILNNLRNNNIIVGQKLLVLSEESIEDTNKLTSDQEYYVVKNGDTLYSISRRYDLPLNELKKINNLSNNNINIGQRLLVNSYSRSNRFHTELKKYRWPIEWKGVTSPYGYRYHPVLKIRRLHSGVDLRASINTPVYSSYYGNVTYAGWMRGYGKIIIIKHPRGYSTRYAHLNKIFVKKGENINEGKLIGKSGNTGISTGPHLHYEIRYNEKPLDPLKYKN